MHVAATGESDGYYADYAARRPQCLARALAEGFAYQGEHSALREVVRGAKSAHLPPRHSSTSSRITIRSAIAPSASGSPARRRRRRFAPSPPFYLLLRRPLLFMGEEGGVSPFLFFCDFAGDLANAVREGRRPNLPASRRFNTRARANSRSAVRGELSGQQA